MFKISTLSLFLFVGKISFSQTDSVQTTKHIYRSLFLVMTLADTTGHPFVHQAANEYKLYEFKIDTLLRGEYDGESIWVICTKEQITQFNYAKKPGYPYYWILSRKMILPDGKVIYRKSGAW